MEEGASARLHKSSSAVQFCHRAYRSLPEAASCLVTTVSEGNPLRSRKSQVPNLRKSSGTRLPWGGFFLCKPDEVAKFSPPEMEVGLPQIAQVINDLCSRVCALGEEKVPRKRTSSSPYSSKLI